MNWNLYLDDLRTPPADRDWLVCRSSQEALDRIAELGTPQFISFDHDLGGDDTSMVFLNRWVRIPTYADPTRPGWHAHGKVTIPDYQIHSANPVGAQNIRSFMESWRRSIEDDGE
jgi:hypothetical protein